MQKQEIEIESKKSLDYFEKYWPVYSDINFDKTFSLRNWTTIFGSIILHFSKNNIPFEKRLKNIFSDKKILHIGCGPGYFLEVVKSLGDVPYGIEPYCNFREGLNIHKNKVEDLINSELRKNKFDIIVAHDLFVPSIIFNTDKAHKILFSLKDYLSKEGIIVLEHQNEETVLKEDILRKIGYSVELINPYGDKCMQIIIKK